MRRNLQLMQLVARFNKDFEDSLMGLNSDEQLIVTGTFRKVIPLFVKHEEGYYDQFYEIYEQELLSRLRQKAKPIYLSHLTDYFDQGSSKLMDIQAELKLKMEEAGEQELTDEEYVDFMKQVKNIIDVRHQILLISAPPPTNTIKKKNEELSGEGPIKVNAETDEYMSIEDCAQFLNCSKVTIHEYKKNGLPFYRIGRTVKFRKSEVLNFMRQHEKKKR